MVEQDRGPELGHAAARASRPEQAVILAGGRGTRLMPLTATRPKPMVIFHGRPFLEYLIEDLRQQGITRILILVGYLSEVIVDHFADGSRFGVSIRYSAADADTDTGERLRLARDLIEPEFLLCYCDNYVPFSLEKMTAAWQAAPPGATLVTVYANDDGYTRSNLKVDATGRVSIYDKSRTAPDLAGVDIGYILTHHAVIDQIPEGNASFERSIYPRLVADGLLYAYMTHHRYYSVGDHARLPITASFLSRRKAVILDRDGTVNQRMPQAHYVRSWDEWTWLPGALQAIASLSRRGYLVIVVTNQPGIARGAMTAEALDEIHGRFRTEVEEAGGQIDAIYHCPHNWDEGCLCRKPAPGMLFAAQRDFHLDLSRCLFIGDDSRDEEAAMRAQCPFIYVTDTVSLGEIVANLN